MNLLIIQRIYKFVSFWVPNKWIYYIFIVYKAIRKVMAKCLEQFRLLPTWVLDPVFPTLNVGFNRREYCSTGDN